MEWWILLGLAVLAIAVVAALRVRNRRHRRAEGKPGNIYPLW